MVRGGGQLVYWLRVMSGKLENLRSTGSKVVPVEIQLLTSPWWSSVGRGNGIVLSRQMLSSAAGRKPGFIEAPIGLRGLRVNSARFCTAAKSDAPSPPAFDNKESAFDNKEESSTYAAPRYHGAADPKPKNDRFFRARNNSTVAHMLKLLEAAPSKFDVEKILNDRMAELTQDKRWPWMPLLDALQRGPNPCLALEVFNWKKDKFEGGDPKEYAKMISTAGRLSQLDMATSLFQEMEARGVKRNSITCNALISAYSKNNQVAQAIAMFKEMQESADCKPTLVTYNTLISMFNKSSIKDMETYYHACKEAGFYPDRVTYNSIIWGYMRAGLFDEMEDSYQQLKKAGCKPDPITFTALISGFSKAGSLEKMNSAFSHMQEEGYAVTTLIAETMVEFYAAERQFADMERIMKIVSCTPGTTCSSRIYTSAVQAYAETGRIKEMEETIQRMLDSRRLFSTSKALEVVIRAYAEKSDFERLEQMLMRVKSLGWSYQLTTFHTLIYEYGRIRQFEKMEGIFEDMKKSKDVLPCAETYQILADSYNAAGDEEMLLRSVERMQAAGFDPRVVVEKEVDHAWTDEEIFNGRRR